VSVEKEGKKGIQVTDFGHQKYMKLSKKHGKPTIDDATYGSRRR
jgi:hypothetical protein